MKFFEFSWQKHCQNCQVGGKRTLRIYNNVTKFTKKCSGGVFWHFFSENCVNFRKISRDFLRFFVTLSRQNIESQKMTDTERQCLLTDDEVRSTGESNVKIPELGGGR